MAQSLTLGEDGEPSPGDRPRFGPARLLRDETGVVAMLITLVLTVGAFQPGFLDPDNLLSTARNAVYVGLLAAGMVFPLAMREVDLSVGGTFALSMVAGALLMSDGVPPWGAVPLVLLLGAGLGAMNGLLTTYLGIPSFIVTLATALLYRGVALAFAAGKQIVDVPRDSSFFTLLGGKASLVVLLVLAALLTVLLTRTRFGARGRAIGSNPDAATLTGLPVDRVRVQALAFSGLTAAAAGVLALAFFMAGDPTLGEGFELTAIAAAIIGGTPLAGGRGSVPGAVAGALILAAVTSALVFFRVPINWTSFATGAVILAAVATDAAIRRRRGRKS